MMEFAPALLVLPILAKLSLIDIRERRIPNKVTFPSFLAFFFLLFILSRTLNLEPEFSRALLGAATAFLFFLSLYAIYPQGIGLGDVKLSALIGLLLGWVSFEALMYGVLAMFLLSFFYSVFLVLRNRHSLHLAFPFAPFMTLGYIVGMILR